MDWPRRDLRDDGRVGLEDDGLLFVRIGRRCTGSLGICITAGESAVDGWVDGWTDARNSGQHEGFSCTVLQ